MAPVLSSAASMQINIIYKYIHIYSSWRQYSLITYTTIITQEKMLIKTWNTADVLRKPNPCMFIYKTMAGHVVPTLSSCENLLEWKGEKYRLMRKTHDVHISLRPRRFFLASALGLSLHPMDGEIQFGYVVTDFCAGLHKVPCLALKDLRLCAVLLPASCRAGICSIWLGDPFHSQIENM